MGMAVVWKFLLLLLLLMLMFCLPNDRYLNTDTHTLMTLAAVFFLHLSILRMFHFTIPKKFVFIPCIHCKSIIFFSHLYGIIWLATVRIAEQKKSSKTIDIVWKLCIIILSIYIFNVKIIIIHMNEEETLNEIHTHTQKKSFNTFVRIFSRCFGTLFAMAPKKRTFKIKLTFEIVFRSLYETFS